MIAQLTKTTGSAVLAQLLMSVNFNDEYKSLMDTTVFSEGTAWGDLQYRRMSGIERMKKATVTQLDQQQQQRTLRTIARSITTMDDFLAREENAYLADASDESKQRAYDLYIQAQARGWQANPVLSAAYKYASSQLGWDKDARDAHAAMGQLQEDIVRGGLNKGNRQAYAIGKEIAMNLFNEWEPEYDERGNVRLDANGRPIGRWVDRGYDREAYSYFSKGAAAKLGAELNKQLDLFSGLSQTRDGSDAVAAGVRQLSEMMKKYSDALAPLKDIFGNDMDKMLDTLKTISGGRNITQLGATNLKQIAQAIAYNTMAGNYNVQDIQSASMVMQARMDDNRHRGLSVSELGSAMEQAMNYLSAKRDSKLSPFASDRTNAAIAADYMASTQNSGGATVYTAAVAKYMDDLDNESKARKAEIDKDKKLSDEERQRRKEQIDKDIARRKTEASSFVAAEIQKRIDAGADPIQAAMEFGGFQSMSDVYAMRASGNWVTAQRHGKRVNTLVDALNTQKADILDAFKWDMTLQRGLGIQTPQQLNHALDLVNRMMDFRANGGSEILNLADTGDLINQLKQARDRGAVELQGLSDEDIEQMAKARNLITQDPELNNKWVAHGAGVNLKESIKQEESAARVMDNIKDNTKGLSANWGGTLFGLVEDAYRSGTGINVKSFKDIWRQASERGDVSLLSDPAERGQVYASSFVALNMVSGHYSKEAEAAQIAKIDKQIAEAEKRLASTEPGTKEHEKAQQALARLRNQREATAMEYAEGRKRAYAEAVDIEQSDAVKQNKDYQEVKAELDDIFTKHGDALGREQENLDAANAKLAKAQQEYEAASQNKNLTPEQLAEYQKRVDEARAEVKTAEEGAVWTKKAENLGRDAAIIALGNGQSLKAINQTVFKDATGKTLSAEDQEAQRMRLKNALLEDPKEGNKIVQAALLDNQRGSLSLEGNDALDSFREWQKKNGKSGNEGYNEWLAEYKEANKGNADKLVGADELSAEVDKVAEKTESAEARALSAEKERQNKMDNLLDLALKALQKYLGGDHPNPPPAPGPGMS